jgi:formylglycine-generating enzyme
LPLRLSRTRLALGLVTPAALLTTAALAFGGFLGTTGCASEQTTPAGGVVGAPPIPSSTPPGAGPVGTVSFRAQRDGLSGSTYASAPGLLAGIAVSQPSRTPLDDLFANAGKAGSPSDWMIPNNGLCPADMASIDDRFCVDRYEASLVEVLPDGTERPFSPYQSLHGEAVRAVSQPGVFPQGYISEVQATQACALSGKRLCKAREWRQACMGPEKKTYGYANQSETGRCNDHGRSPMGILYAGENLAKRDKWDWERMNRPELNQIEGTLAHTGEHDGCTNGYGVYDMVGNLHEWVDDPNGTFQGGYYQDTTLNGEGCQYVTMAHEARYHDYSTGFRCCSDVAP